MKKFHLYYGVTCPINGYEEIKASKSASAYAVNSSKAIWSPDVLKDRAVDISRIDKNDGGSTRKELSPVKLACVKSK